MIVPIMTLVVGLVVAGIGVVTWRSGGRGLTLSAANFVALAALLLLPPGATAARYTALAIVAGLTVTTFATGTPAAWRRARPELMLAALTILAIAASYSFTDVSRELQTTLLVLVVVLGTTFLAVTLLRFLSALRSVQMSGPK